MGNLRCSGAFLRPPESDAPLSRSAGPVLRRGHVRNGTGTDRAHHAACTGYSKPCGESHCAVDSGRDGFDLHRPDVFDLDFRRPDSPHRACQSRGCGPDRVQRHLRLVGQLSCGIRGACLSIPRCSITLLQARHLRLRRHPGHRLRRHDPQAAAGSRHYRRTRRITRVLTGSLHDHVRGNELADTTQQQRAHCRPDAVFTAHRLRAGLSRGHDRRSGRRAPTSLSFLPKACRHAGWAATAEPMPT